MTGEEAAGANSLKTFKVYACLGTMTNDFEYVEAIVRSWISSSKERRSYFKTQRKNSADKFCTLLGELEKIVGIELPTKSKFEECIHSDAIEDWHAIFLMCCRDFVGKS